MAESNTFELLSPEAKLDMLLRLVIALQGDVAFLHTRLTEISASLHTVARATYE